MDDIYTQICIDYTNISEVVHFCIFFASIHLWESYQITFYYSVCKKI